MLGAPPPPTARPNETSIGSVADALGVLYVIEGSTLGGRIIGRMLERSLGATQADGAAFYHSYGEDRGPKWAAYKAALDRFGDETPSETDRVIGAASASFDAMESWMAEAVL